LHSLARPGTQVVGPRTGRVGRHHLRRDGARAALLETYTAMDQRLQERSALGAPARQAIHLTVANVNACEYCQAAYTGAAKAAGHGEDTTVAIRRSEVAGDDKLTTMLLLPGRSRRITATSTPGTASSASRTWSRSMWSGAAWVRIRKD
jgi:AhpD family alkylhydroperoxidase